MNAIAATFVDVKTVKTRGQIQIILEAPIEQADRILSALGGIPLPGQEKWVGIVLLKEKPDQIVLEPKEPRRMADLPLSQQAAMLCENADFIKWVMDRADIAWIEGCLEGEQHPRTASSAVRSLCGVLSRSEFDTSETAAQRWKHLYGEWEHHKSGYTR